MRFPIPENERARLAYLDGVGPEIDVPPGEIQALCQLAARVMDCPIGLVSLVGATDQCFVANEGLDGVSGTPRRVSFCAHAIMAPGQMIVGDATKDPRFVDNPLVTGAPHIRAYCGTVLEPEPGIRIGTLCVIDTRPRRFTAAQRRDLAQLGHAVERLFHLHRERRALAEQVRLRRLSEVRLRIAADVDPLSELLNLRSFRRVVDAHLSQDARGALCVFDADNFKQVNDRNGHPFGDRYLKMLADALGRSLPRGARAARLGGDEFATFLPGADEDAARRYVDQCRSKAMAGALALGEPDLGRLSVGVGLIGAGETPVAREGETPYDALYQQADIALYASKEHGRNRTTFYDQALAAERDMRALRAEFADGLRQGRIIPHYQPIVELGRGVIGVEALARWDHPGRGLLAPGAFAPILTDRSAAPDLTQAILHRAVRDVAGWKADLRVSVNVTAYDLSDPEFVPDIDHLLAEVGLPWSRLVFEVTEHVVMGGVDDRIHRALGAVRSRGGLVALDDFGTGYGGLQHLRSWPIDLIKFDRSFTAGLPFDARCARIVAAILQLGADLGLECVVEGIETRAQLDELADLGCRVAQGYAFGRPMSETDLRTWLSARPDLKLVQQAG